MTYGRVWRYVNVFVERNMAFEPFMKMNATVQRKTLREIAGVLHQVAAAAESLVPVVLFGHRGAGTNFLARLIHKTSPRAAAPWVALQCGLYPRHTQEAQFFGRSNSTRSYIRTAHGKTQGRIAAAERGTLFIDQVQNASPRIQTELLRLLRDGEFHDTTDNMVRSADVRIVVSARPDLAAHANAGQFDAQLFKRLNVMPIHVPRSCASPEAVLDAIAFLRREACADGEARFPADVIALQQAVGDAAATVPTDAPIHTFLHAVIRELCCRTASVPASASAPPNGMFDELAHRLERVLIEHALTRHNGIQSMAAELLGLSRMALGAKMLDMGLAAPALNAA
jgi:two-component system, NtrC family, response regulator HupR/HoxA